MSLAKEQLHKIANPPLTRNERAQLCVRLSRELEESGNYEGAREAMGEFWTGVGERPVLDNLTRPTAAEVIWRVGVLISCIGSAKQVDDAQETAKNLIYESIRTFTESQDIEKVAEAKSDLAYCYWRQGAFDEARLILQEVLNELADIDSEVKAIAFLRIAIVERTSQRLNEALSIYNVAAPLFEKSKSHVLKGKFYVGLALVLRNLGAAERRTDYLDRALIEYSAASFHFEQAGNERYCARVENNLGFLYSTVNQFTEAHEHVGRARQIFARLKDRGSVAQVDDTRAKVLLAEGRAAEAEVVARSAVETLEKGGEQSLLAEALTTHGVALARTGRYVRARSTLERAITVAEQVGDRDSAGQAALAIIEELSEYCAPDELAAVYLRADESLAESQHPGINDRLRLCARKVFDVYAVPLTGEGAPAVEFSAPAEWKGFSFKREMHRYERFLIERALRDAGGVVTRAAQLLGFRHHYSLISLINKRHKNLLEARSPVVPRRRSIIRDARNERARHAEEKAARPVTILHVEDNHIVASAVKDTLELEGWRVETCLEGTTALKRIAGNTHYDLLLLDKDLPGINGLELVRTARKLSHRRRTPIIMFSARDCETEAWGAGVDAFLRKPEDVLAVVETISRLLESEDEEDEED